MMRLGTGAMIDRAVAVAWVVLISVLSGCGGSVYGRSPGNDEGGACDGAGPVGSDCSSVASDSGIDAEAAVDVKSLGPGACRGNDDCSSGSGYHCVSPGASAGVGICRAVRMPCTTDSECRTDGGDLICDIAVDTCPPIVKGCVPGCADQSSCADGEACNAQHCVPIGCDPDTQCPTDFACSDGICRRKTCAADADCGAFCVNGSCYSMPGVCTQPVP
jgi:hypothetical protein